MKDRRVLQGILMLTWLTASPSLVFAHVGGMSSEDFRPMAVSAAVAFVSYWLVLLWPSRPPTAKGRRGRSMKTPSDLNRPEQPLRQTHRLRQVPHLRTVGGPNGRDSDTSE